MDAIQGTAGLKFFVGGVPNEAKRRELLAYFRQFGVVKRITNFNPNHGKKLFGFCFVKFESLSSEALFDKSRQFTFAGRTLEVDPIIRRSCLRRRVEERHLRRVFLPALPPQLSKEDLQELFGGFGSIVNCFVVERKDKRATACESAPDGASADSSAGFANYGYVIFDEQSVAQMLVARGSIRIGPQSMIPIVRYCPNAAKAPGAALATPESPRLTTCSKGELTSQLALRSAQLVKPTIKSYHSLARSSIDAAAREQVSNLRFNLRWSRTAGDCHRPRQFREPSANAGQI